MQRIFELDGIRAIAILLVMLFHVAIPVMPGGWVGVDVFFVLSGFLITSILLNEYETYGHINLKAFYIRRARRLLPAVTLLLICYGAFLITIGQPVKRVFTAFLATHLYAVNWLMALDTQVDFGPFYHFWSLSVEEQFYLLWPISLIGILAVKRIRRKIPFLLLMLAALVAAWRITLYFSGASPNRILYGFDVRVDALLIGCALAFATNRTFRIPGPIAAVCLSIVMLIAAGIEPPGHLAYEGTVAAVCVVGCLLWLLQASEAHLIRRALRFRPLIWIGQVSYGLYLWHVPIQNHFSKPEWPLALSAGRVFALTFCAAALSYYFIERPILNRKRGLVERPGAGDKFGDPLSC